MFTIKPEKTLETLTVRRNNEQYQSADVLPAYHIHTFIRKNTLHF